MTSPLPAYHPTLSSALSALSAHLVERKIVLNEADAFDAAFAFGGISYGENKSAHAQIATVKDKPTRKWGHVTIWRETNGRYEINFYIL